MFTKAQLSDEEKLDEASVLERRQQFIMGFSRTIAILAAPAGVVEIIAWLFLPQIQQILILGLLSLNAALWPMLYPLFRKRGYSALGTSLSIGSILLFCIFCMLAMPEARLGGFGGFIGVVLISNFAFGRRGGYWFIGISLVLMVATILVENSPYAPKAPPFEPTVSILVSLFITVVLFIILSILISNNTKEHDTFFIQTIRSEREIERRIATEQQQREHLQQANLEIERGAEADRVQRKTLADILDQVREIASGLNTATAEILAATTQQASGASEQSAAIAQTTTTVDEVKVIAEQATVRSQEVDDAFQRAVQVSQTGQKAVQETITSMNLIKDRVEGIAENVLALSEQTQKIGEIISTVSDLASQSNMLALNASIEASRAGEAGKGFSVVAQEMRTLAEQSKDATVQVKNIIGDIQKATNATVMATEEGNKGVDIGVKRVLQAREAIESLSAAVDDNVQIARQVSAGGRQQQTGMEQIATAMQNINQATVQSLVSTRQTEKAAQSLSDLARQLVGIVEKN
jgi:methyl-accepting chemotaxis protein